MFSLLYLTLLLFTNLNAKCSLNDTLNQCIKLNDEQNIYAMYLCNNNGGIHQTLYNNMNCTEQSKLNQSLIYNDTNCYFIKRCNDSNDNQQLDETKMSDKGIITLIIIIIVGGMIVIYFYVVFSHQNINDTRDVYIFMREHPEEAQQAKSTIVWSKSTGQ